MKNRTNLNNSYSDTEETLKSLSHNNTLYPLGNIPVGVFTAGININGTCDMAGGKLLLKMGIISNYTMFCLQHQKQIETWGPIHYQSQHALSQLSRNSIWKIYWNSREMIQLDYPLQLTQDILSIVKQSELKH
jgi:hypothetical protein